MFLEGITVLRCLSVTATFSTIVLFLCGVPICVNIWRRKSTKDITPAPFLIGLLGGSYWLRYGLLKGDYTMVTVNLTAVILMTAYLIFFVFFSSSKLFIGVSISLVLLLISAMAYLVEKYNPAAVIDPLGFACMTFNIINFGAPLAGLKVVIRQHSCETLPLPMCMGNFLVSSQWCFYGILTEDIYIIVPNAIGVSLALLQLSLFLIFPMKPGKESFLRKIWKTETDVEKGASQPKKSWIPEHITGKDLADFDSATHVRLEKKRFSCLPVIELASLNGSEATDDTEISQCQSISIEKETDPETASDSGSTESGGQLETIMYVSGL